MKKIELTQGKFALVDNQDYELVKHLKWRFSNHGYAVREEKGTSLYLHRLLLKTPKGMITDHINLNKLDNRRKNLRIVNAGQNIVNKPKRKSLTSIYKGVRLHKNNRWTSQITFNKKMVYLGSFSKEHHAAMAYDIWAKDIHKDYALLNF